ncbi:ABC transporter permease [Mycoplasmopsis gallopavonis]|uniref:Oligopeptide ABC transporter permease n=1 Tax=Mycoplasmopsis gallopavonis TaxID=76629 RepID=A0A449B0A4_9BACT|nr:ABC transporter permease [Mycoplasmopsis gallopavonis]RIV16552.1 ABC transporter permease [Mycoplasmopsis gallopavonis]VEU73221.1 oligopeptide ABC transporter permease [Mycoplasmopsis gallopavonis]
MLKYISQRIFFAILTLLIIILVVYLSVAIFTENPFVKKLQNEQSNNLSESAKRALFDESVRLHLTPNVNYEDYKNNWFTLKVNPFVRLLYWFKDIFNKNAPFGLPYNPQILITAGADSIPHYFFKYLKFSIIITLPSFIISAIFGIILGVIAGYKRGTTFDVVINFFSLIFIALPSFVIAPILISVLLSVNVPPIFYNPFSETDIIAHGWNRIILSWIPPILIIVLGSLSAYISYARNQVVSVLTSNYVLIAKSKGLSTSEIFFKYVFRNISIPLAAIIIPSYIGLLSGGIVIETYWKVPGTSQVLAQSFPNGEINLIMFSTAFFTTLGLFTTIIVDIIYTILDPRIKYGSTSKYSIRAIVSAYFERNKAFKELAIHGKKGEN